MTFEYPFFLFLVPPLFLFLYALFKYRSGEQHPISFLLRKNFRSSCRYDAFRFFLLAFSLIFLVIALAYPQNGLYIENIAVDGFDVVFALDVSKSMKTRDISTSNLMSDRLTLAKKLIEQFVRKNLHNQYGLVIFAGEAIAISPLSFDHRSLLHFLKSADDRSVGKQGSHIQKALRSALSLFPTGKGDDIRGKAIILLSDGEDEGFHGIVTTNDIRVFTVGVGTTQGAPIPDGKTDLGDSIYKTFQGKTVVSRLNEKPLKELAVIGNGMYYNASQNTDIYTLFERFTDFRSNVIEVTDVTRKGDLYPFVISFVFFILFLDTFFDFRFLVRSPL